MVSSCIKWFSALLILRKSEGDIISPQCQWFFSKLTTPNKGWYEHREEAETTSG